MENTERFSGLAEIYRKYRPGYPDALFDFFVSEFGLGPASAVAEIGSGTGIFARLLLERGAGCCYAVEPNDDMRGCAERELAGFSGFHSLPGSAEATGLADASVDLVFAAQAFHWFDPERFRAECRRILRPGGRTVIVWNSRIADDPAMEACREVCARCCREFTGFSGQSVRSGEKAVAGFFPGGFDFCEFPNHLRLDREAFLGRNLSSSYAPREGSAAFDPFVTGLEAVFDRFAESGRLRWANVTRCYSGRLEG